MQQLVVGSRTTFKLDALCLTCLERPIEEDDSPVCGTLYTIHVALSMSWIALECSPKWQVSSISS